MGQARSLAPFQAKVTHAEHLGYTNVSVEKQYSSDIYSGCIAVSEKHVEFYGRIVFSLSSKRLVSLLLNIVQYYTCYRLDMLLRR